MKYEVKTRTPEVKSRPSKSQPPRIERERLGGGPGNDAASFSGNGRSSGNGFRHIGLGGFVGGEGGGDVSGELFYEADMVVDTLRRGNTWL